MPCSYEFSAISSSRDEEKLSGIEEMEAELNAGRNTGVQDFRYGIAKILQGLRKFRNHSENFAILAKFRYGHIFAMIAIAKFRYGHIFAMIAKIRYHSKNSLS